MPQIAKEYVGKTACYDQCEIGHQCFGGYLNDYPICNQEWARIYDLLVAAFPGEKISLQARSGKGIYFTHGDQYLCVIQNELGVWIMRDKPIQY
jgi:hypothetical protein